MSIEEKNARFLAAYGGGPLPGVDRGRRILSGAYCGEEVLYKGERALILSHHRTRKFENDGFDQILVQWDNTQLDGSHGWVIARLQDFDQLHYTEDN